MAALATGMIGVIFFAGRPEPVRPTSAPQLPDQQVSSPERVREYQQRLRLLEGRTPSDQGAEAVVPPSDRNDRPVQRAAATPSDDPVAAERRRRDYESLFATNVVLSRRPEAERPGGSPPSRGAATAAAASGDGAPSIDDIADAVVRATTRAGAAVGGAPAPSAVVAEPSAADGNRPRRTERSKTPEPTGPIVSSGRTHRLLEGTVIETVLTNRLDGTSASPVNCLVTTPVYSHDREHILIPAGARALGETKAVQSLGETRLAVSFHRLVMPDGSTYPLDSFIGTNQVGDSGLRDQVNHHYWSTFGVAGAVGLISGLAQYIGTLGLGRGDGDRTLVIAGSASDATSQASLQVMNRFLNRMPTVTIREGHRVKVYLTSDLDLPAYDAASR